MKIQLSDHFDYKRLLRFTFPSIMMMIFTSIYGVVDGVFVSNYVGKTPFAALNLIMPFPMIFGAVGFMIGTGGSALVSMTLGEGDRERANRLFSMLIYVTIIFGVVMSVIGLVFMRPAAILLGATDDMVDYCVEYGSILMISLTAFMLQNTFQSFLITAEKPQLGLYVTVAAGVTNMVLDALFVAVFKCGLAGAAVATALSQAVGGVIPLIYFIRPNSSLLKLTKAGFDGRALLRTCTNGSSEFMTNISSSVVSMLYNYQLMRIAGENGVAAYGVLMYVNFIFLAIYIGYSIGTAPVIGFHYGAQNHDELHGLLTQSLKLLVGMGAVLTVLAIALAKPLASIFVSYDAELLDMTVRAFMIYSVSFLFSGVNIFGSSFFTALNNGLVSAAISFLRTLVFQLSAVLILPELLGLDGIWLSVVAAEVFALAVTSALLIKMRGRYRY